jgi:hypothetical protein
MMTNNELMEWLIGKAEPVIKYRTLRELAGLSDKDTEKLKEELIEHPQVQTRLGYLKSQKNMCDFRFIHGRENKCLENCIPMLTDFGFKKGITEFDRIMVPLIQQAKEKPWNIAPVFCEFGQIVVYPFFLKGGYYDDDLLFYMYERLNTLYNFVLENNYDIYDFDTKYKGIPKSFQNRPIIKPELYINGRFKIPLIYDIYGLAALANISNKEITAKIQKVIQYILSPEYNRFITFYGILSSGKRRYHAMGWDCKLPFYFNDMDINRPNLYLHRLELMAHFPNAVKCGWFERGLKHFESFKTEKGTYTFPKEYLLERESVWVLGTHMSLGENRKNKQFIEIESTFRMLKIKKVAGLL